MNTMVCMGDSLTEGTDISVGHTWTALVANTLNLEVINGGIGGDTTAGMLARFHSQVVAGKPAFAFIMGGTNDLWWGWEVNTALGNLFSMVVQARHVGIVPVIGLPLPVNISAAKAGDFSPPLGGYDQFSDKLEALIEALIFHSTESDVSVVDLYRPFTVDNRQVRTELFLPDGLHPSNAGHQAIANEMAAVFRRDFNFQ